jgi:hypothetical protein
VCAHIPHGSSWGAGPSSEGEAKVSTPGEDIDLYEVGRTRLTSAAVTRATSSGLRGGTSRSSRPGRQCPRGGRARRRSARRRSRPLRHRRSRPPGPSQADAARPPPRPQNPGRLPPHPPAVRPRKPGRLGDSARTARFNAGDAHAAGPRPRDTCSTRTPSSPPASIVRRIPAAKLAAVMWRSCLRALQPVDAGDSALPRSGTPLHPFLSASNRPGVAGARIAGDGNADAQRDRDEKADASANLRGRSRG